MANNSLAEAIDALPRNTYLIPESMFAVLKKLPVESLLRFKVVCPAFRNLFENHSFIRMHYDEAKTISCLVLHGSPPLRPARVYRQLNIPPPPFRFPRVFRLNGSADVSAERLPFPRLYHYDKLVGCTLGIVCIGTRDACFFVLWNPATKMIKLFDVPNMLREETRTQVSVGFGYDSVVHSFKIIRIVDFRVQIYSSNTDIWVPFEAGALFDGVARLESPTIVRGDPYWLAHKDAGEKFFMYFDTARNTFEIVDAPLFRVYLSFELDGALATLRLNGEPRLEDGLPILEDGEVWVRNMNDTTWSPKYSFSFGPFVNGIASFFQFWKGTFLAKTHDERTVLYNPGEEISFGLRVHQQRCEACVYTESLASVPGMHPVRVEEEEAQDEAEPFVARI